MNDIAIRVEGLGKQYRIGKRERYTLRDTLTDAVTAPARRLRSALCGAHSEQEQNPGDLIWGLEARLGTRGAGHFNERPQSYWIDKFADLGSDFDPEFSRHLQSLPDTLARNVMVFCRR